MLYHLSTKIVKIMSTSSKRTSPEKNYTSNERSEPNNIREKLRHTRKLVRPMTSKFKVSRDLGLKFANSIQQKPLFYVPTEQRHNHAKLYVFILIYCYENH